MNGFNDQVIVNIALSHHTPKELQRMTVGHRTDPKVNKSYLSPVYLYHTREGRTFCVETILNTIITSMVIAYSKRDARNTLCTRSCHLCWIIRVKMPHRKETMKFRPARISEMHRPPPALL